MLVYVNLLSYSISLNYGWRGCGHTLSAPAPCPFDVGFEHSWLFFVKYFRVVEVGSIGYGFLG